MLKWIHRGIVLGLLVVAIVATVFSIVRHDATLVTREKEYKNEFSGFLMGIEERRLHSMWVVRPPSLMAGSRQFTFECAGFSIWRAEWGPSFTTMVNVPFWMIAAIAAPYPMFFLFRAHRRRRVRPVNGCPHCTYDLTLNESGICPECGEACSEAS